MRHQYSFSRVKGRRCELLFFFMRGNRDKTRYTFWSTQYSITYSVRERLWRWIIFVIFEYVDHAWSALGKKRKLSPIRCDSLLLYCLPIIPLLLYPPRTLFSWFTLFLFISVYSLKSWRSFILVKAWGKATHYICIKTQWVWILNHIQVPFPKCNHLLPHLR